MTDEDEKPHGWIAWHPKRGNLPFSYAGMFVGNSFDDALDEMKADFGLQEEFERANASPASPCLNLGRDWLGYFISQGWRIRPVKLVFLDE